MSGQNKLDLWNSPAMIPWRTSQRVVVLDADELPRRLELARIEVPTGSHLIARRVWQSMTVLDAEAPLPAPQANLVTDPAYLELLIATADAAPRWHLIWRRFDDDQNIPPFPQDVGPGIDGGFDVLEDPIEGWSREGAANYLFPWGCSAEQRIQIPGQGALSLYCDVNEEATDLITAVGGLLQGECRPIIDTPDFRAWFERR